MQILHDWLEGKRQSRQSGRVVGESRTGKTMGCDAYRLRNKPSQVAGKPPIVPVAYIQIPQECGAKEFFGVISEYPNCGARFKFPALWVDCWCQRCFVSSTEMVKWQKAIHRNATSP
ncbi:MAG: TniB family NTP-binding protein [Nostoc sp.]|uniref:TniB family NTP-binding protein n=1 Tax=Nostoc sp. TaxID=1180 RepID=UPI002FF7653D